MFGFRESVTIERKPDQVCSCVCWLHRFDNSLFQDPFLLCNFSNVDHLKLYSSRSVLLKWESSSTRQNRLSFEDHRYSCATFSFRSAYEYWTHGPSLMDVADKMILHTDLVISTYSMALDQFSIFSSVWIATEAAWNMANSCPCFSQTIYSTGKDPADRCLYI